MPNIDELKRYAVLDPGCGDVYLEASQQSEQDAQEALLQMCMEAAVEWFKNAGVKPPAEPSRLYDLGVYMLAVHYFDNRGVIGAKDDQLPLGVFSIMHQLRT